MTIALDHLVILAADLAAGVDWLRDRTGIDLPPGGAHPLMGTHNHLGRIDGNAFIEVIAPDPDAPAPGRPRWYGLDHPPAQPVLGHLVVRTDDPADFARLPAESGPAIDVRRGAYTWHLSVPEDGSLPFDGCGPSLIHWHDSPIPPAAMPDTGARLTGLDLVHPKAERIADVYAPFLTDLRLTLVSGDTPSLSARLSLNGREVTLA